MKSIIMKEPYVLYVAITHFFLPEEQKWKRGFLMDTLHMNERFPFWNFLKIWQEIGGGGWGLVNTGIVKLMNIVWKRSIYEYIPIRIILLHKYLGTVCIYCSVTNYTYYLDLYSFRSLHSTVSLLKLTVGQHCSNYDYKWNACYTHASIHTKMS